MFRKIIHFPSPILRKKAKAVKRITPEIVTMINERRTAAMASSATLKFAMEAQKNSGPSRHAISHAPQKSFSEIHCMRRSQNTGLSHQQFQLVQDELQKLQQGDNLYDFEKE